MIPVDRLEEFTKDCRHWNGCNLANPPDHLGCSVCLEGGHRDSIVPMTLQKAAELMAEALEAVEWGGDTYCLWCGAYWKKAHDRHCKRRVALAAWKACNE